MFVGGPYSSAELKALIPLVSQNQCAIINTSSSAIGLNYSEVFACKTGLMSLFRFIIHDGHVTDQQPFTPLPDVELDIFCTNVLQKFCFSCQLT